MARRLRLARAAASSRSAPASHDPDQLGEEGLRGIVSQAPGAVFRAFMNGPIDFMSDTIMELTGYPAAHFLQGGSKAWLAIVSPKDQHMRQLRLENMLQRRPYQIEYRIIHANGDERWVLENGRPQRGTDGDAIWIDGILSDISERKQDEQYLDPLFAAHGGILDNVMLGVMFTREGRIVAVNRCCAEVLGHDSSALVGASLEAVVASDDYLETREAHFACMRRGESSCEERSFQRRDGSTVWFQVRGSALVPGRPEEGVFLVFTDITTRREAEEKLRMSAAVLENIADGVVVVDLEGIIVAVNPAFTRITGYSESEVLGQHNSLRHSSRQDDAFYEAKCRTLHETGCWRGEQWNKRKDGEYYLEGLTLTGVCDDAGSVKYYVGVFSDITKARESQDELDRMAHYDLLTALPNRLLFHDRLRHAMVRSARSEQQLAVLFIDLDRFKDVNDTLGHHVGDELLKKVARTLAGRLRDGDTLARLGGDEFIVLLENTGEDGARRVAAKLVAAFEQPFSVADNELFVTCSVGVSLFPQDSVDLNMLIRNADVAMYQAKALGRNGYQMYAAAMSAEGAERLRLESLLRRAIEKNEISLDYQPQFETAGGQMIGVEALARWYCPELGQVSPARFIPLAEEMGFISELGKWVLVEACRQMVRWSDAGLDVPKIAVNLSVRQFERGGIAAMVEGVLRETGLAPHRLQLEVTESVLMNTDDAMAYINELNRIGVGLAIDDFGTGYSSLAYLKKMPVHTLKIDRSFIKDISTDANDEAIAIAIIQLAKSLNLSVIAEGVETEDQASFLRKNGCTNVQGYLYGRPMTAAAILTGWGPDSQVIYAGGRTEDCTS
jgi:diguanylate cyclase (GGDEF)-like protein/PAS domain S-box-containing protein